MEGALFGGEGPYGAYSDTLPCPFEVERPQLKATGWGDSLLRVPTTQDNRPLLPHFKKPSSASTGGSQFGVWCHSPRRGMQLRRVPSPTRERNDAQARPVLNLNLGCRHKGCSRQTIGNIRTSVYIRDRYTSLYLDALSCTALTGSAQ